LLLQVCVTAMTLGFSSALPPSLQTISSIMSPRLSFWTLPEISKCPLGEVTRLPLTLSQFWNHSLSGLCGFAGLWAP
jgi:hypothetical protein